MLRPKVEFYIVLKINFLIPKRQGILLLNIIHLQQNFRPSNMNLKTMPSRTSGAGTSGFQDSSAIRHQPCTI
jgi:hypothetical protein